MTHEQYPAPSTVARPRPLSLRGGAHGVLLFHGLSSSPLELQFIARGLHRAGYTVHVPVFEGYTAGLLDGHARQRHADAWIAQAMQHLDQMLETCEKVSIGGLCLGAVLALRIAALRPDRITAVLALSTALHYDGWGNPWYTPLLPLARIVPGARRIGVRERHPFGLKDERMRAWVARQMQVMGQSDAGASVLRVGDLLSARTLIAATRAGLCHIRSDLLLVHAREDECATPRSSFEVAQGTQASRVRVVLLGDSYHMISIDREKDKVLEEMRAFLARYGAVSASVPGGITLAEQKVLQMFKNHEGISNE